MHERRIAVRFVCSRSISHEIVRHRTASVTMESQRYCGYHKNKFNGEIVFIIPEWIKNLRKEIANTIDSLTGASNLYLLSKDLPDAVIEMTAMDRAVSCWYDSMKRSEYDYMFLITDQELKPEDARSVLPNDCKTELVVTMSESQ